MTTAVTRVHSAMAAMEGESCESGTIHSHTPRLLARLSLFQLWRHARALEPRLAVSATPSASWSATEAGAAFIQSQFTIQQQWRARERPS